ncbi:sodium- and chloride-dependent glycine transporter 2-like isoform X2 [Biomphalaria glabrata]|uniref:Transporter n=1 Tax=Biomphalaria glabrata TaxID=6526 RepID=A0A9W3AXV2_BIOGL|nr:sodium- and chloride-dependent glycine transporter 2-like isoform X2 [Biomphalaria glabrata]
MEKARNEYKKDGRHLQGEGEFHEQDQNLLHVEKAKSEDENKGRNTWARKTEYFLSMLGYSVGLGNIWRFPYLCIRNGGGAFLIPYLVCLVLCGLPLFFMEVALGQFMSKGVYQVWNICPLFKGIGIGQIIVNIISGWYYVLLIAWVLIYMVHSFRSPLPWTICGQEWNSPLCVPQGARVLYDANGTVSPALSQSANATGDTVWQHFVVNGTTDMKGLRSSSEEFWLNNVLEISPGLEELNGLPWHSALALFVSFALVLLCVIRGVKSVGKVVYVTATFPFILLTILIIRGATLPGALDGFLFYVTPDWSKLVQVQTWLEASFQVFYSLGPVWGGLVTMSSYNKFHNNCMRDAVILTFVCEGTSFFAGFAIFTVLGHMAYNLNVPVENFAASGSGLAFVVYPEAVSYLPVPQLWALLFFLMLLTVALDTQFVAFEVVMTSLQDHMPSVVKRWEIIMKIVYSCILFLLALPLACRGGIYLFQLMDWYIASFSTAAIGLLQTVAVAWIYGAERFMDDIQLMMGRRPPYLFNVLWRYITPVLLLILLIASLLTYEPPTFKEYHYTSGAVAFGWFIAIFWFLPVPVMAVVQIMKSSGDIKKRLKTVCSPTSEWQPSPRDLKERYHTEKEAPPRSSSLCSKIRGC